ncbi:MAG: thioredoxin family protein [Richelia sp. CSU_2_1]|nr:thioredoxin family protein [Richelia sp. CSU_2_1]
MIEKVRKEAREVARAENKPILINLTGSDWCTWCIKIEKEVFSSKEFPGIRPPTRPGPDGGPIFPEKERKLSP